jgi:hypothetical protein
MITDFVIAKAVFIAIKMRQCKDTLFPQKNNFLGRKNFFPREGEKKRWNAGTAFPPFFMCCFLFS